jgi:hypothetical protein
MYMFGSGNLVALCGAVPAARQFGALQDVSVDFKFTVKSLYGQYQYPLSVARGQASIACKASFAKLQGAVLNDVFFGGTNATGQKIGIVGEAATIPGTPFQVTVANGATFVDDNGVLFALTGVPLVRVTSAPAAGQYSVNASGQYTFNTTDTGKAVLISYTYTVVTGNTTTLVNQLTGAAPTFGVDIPWSYNGQNAVLHFNACVSEQLTIATKLEDFTIPDFSFQITADAGNNIGYVSLSD